VSLMAAFILHFGFKCGTILVMKRRLCHKCERPAEFRKHYCGVHLRTRWIRRFAKWKGQEVPEGLEDLFGDGCPVCRKPWELGRHGFDAVLQRKRGFRVVCPRCHRHPPAPGSLTLWFFSPHWISLEIKEVPHDLREDQTPV